MGRIMSVVESLCKSPCNVWGFFIEKNMIKRYYFYIEGPIAPHPETMFYVYIIKSKKDKSIYIGYTEDLVRRMKEHNSGKSMYTKSKYPYELIYYESYKHKTDARYREDNLKKFAQAYSQLKKRIKNSLE